MIRRAVVVAVAGLLLTAATCGRERFAPNLPQGVPDVSRWEKMSGWSEVQGPRGIIEYELYVNPERLAVYSLTRYRLTISDTSSAGLGTGAEHERLQYDKDGKTVRRYECVPAQAISRLPCEWREFPKGSPEYDREMPWLLWVYQLHNQLLQQRDAKAGTP